MAKKPKFEDPSFDDVGATSGEVKYKPRPEEPNSPVGAVLKKHQNKMMAKPGVKGIGEGTGPLGERAIVVYVANRGTARSLPTQLDGVPVVTEVVGEVDAY